MGDEPTKVDPPGPAPTSRKRELQDADGLEGGDLKRVAEIVMVLEVMGRMRGGSDPTAVEKGLAAEAMNKLVMLCESFKPNDLFTSDAARILAGDLGFNPAKDQIGNRPVRKQISIAEKMALTKKKMEESRDFKPQTSPYPPPHAPVGVGIKPDHRTAATSSAPHRISSEKHHQVPMTMGGFQHASPSVITTGSSFKTLPLNDMHRSVSTSRPASSPAEAPHFRVDSRPGGLPHTVQVQGNHLQDRKTNTSGTFQSAVVKPSQVVNVDRGAAKVEVAHPVNSYQVSSSMVKNQGTVGPSTVVVQGNIQNIGQQSHDSHPVAIVANNDEIAILVHKLLRPKTADPSWSAPQTNYMNNPLQCQVCKINITDSESLLVCDACEKGTHLGCLKLLSQRTVSNVEWYCPSCLQSNNGKPFPPKYGRVTRSHSAAKTSNTSGITTVTEKTTGSSDPKAGHQNTVPTVNDTRSKPASVAVTSNCLEPIQPAKSTNTIEREFNPAVAHHTENKAQVATCANQTELEVGSNSSRTIPDDTSSHDSLAMDTTCKNPASDPTVGENTNIQSDPVVHPVGGQQSDDTNPTQGTEAAIGSVASDMTETPP